MDRQERLEALVAEYDDRLYDDTCTAALHPDARYVLVERELRYGSGYWLSSQHTPHSAGIYHLNQEGDWEPTALIDLDTGDRFRPVMSLEWEPAPDPTPYENPETTRQRGRGARN